MKGSHEPISAFEEKKESKLMRKIKESPFMPIGITGCIGAVIYGIYNYRNRGGMSTSVYLMHLRVKAQGMVVGSLTIGVAYNIIRRIMSTNDNEKKE